MIRLALPIVIERNIDGANGRNWPGFVILDLSAPFPAAVAAQEIWEARYKLNPLNLALTIASPSHKRRMEIMGHECEVQAAVIIYGQAEAFYRRREADAMQRGYDGLFASLTVAEIEAQMRSRSAAARAWVYRNLREIKRHQ